MKTYAEKYEDFTRATVELAGRIQSANAAKFTVRWTLPQVTMALQNLYKDPIFHTKFVGNTLEDNTWSYGFCALASVVIYEMFGRDEVWQPMAIGYKDWKYGSVVFLKDNATGINFNTMGEHYPTAVPYEIGHPIDMYKPKTPNKEIFLKALYFELRNL